MSIKLKECFYCRSNVFQIYDDMFACDTCKSVYRFIGKGWKDVTPDEAVKNRRQFRKVFTTPDDVFN